MHSLYNSIVSIPECVLSAMVQYISSMLCFLLSLWPLVLETAFIGSSRDSKSDLQLQEGRCVWWDILDYFLCNARLSNPLPLIWRILKIWERSPSNKEVFKVFSCPEVSMSAPLVLWSLPSLLSFEHVFWGKTGLNFAQGESLSELCKELITNCRKGSWAETTGSGDHLLEMFPPHLISFISKEGSKWMG